MRLDVHQHLWTEPLVGALRDRSELPFVRDEHELTVLFAAGERPYVIDACAQSRSRRIEALERDGLDRACVCLSSPLGIESLPREQAAPLIEAYNDGALALGEPFAVWGALALDRPEADDVDRLLDRGCVGLSLPAGALAHVEALRRARPLLERLEARGAALLVHPGPGAAAPTAPGEYSLQDPLWWPALTRYVAQMQAAWLAFVTVGRAQHPQLRVIFAMLAGLAPLHGERLRARGGPPVQLEDPLLYYDTSSYGRSARRMVGSLVGEQQLVYGTDRPVVDPRELEAPDQLDWDLLSDAARRALAVAEPVGAA